jgi:uncharacterized protein YecT (DUF1311 family)
MLLAMALAGAGAGQTQAEMTSGTGRDYAAADAAMNVAYRAAMMRMKQRDVVPEHDPDARQFTGPGYQDALLTAQRAWLKFRDSECLIEGYQFRGGSAQSMAVAQCKATLTKARTAQLKGLAR